MSAEPTFIARQPILDQHGRVYGYELLFRRNSTSESCDSSADCPSGAIWKSGTCDIDEASSGDTATGPFKTNWFGLHAAFDFAYLSGSNVCGTPSDFNCYFGGGTPYTARSVSMTIPVSLKTQKPAAASRRAWCKPPIGWKVRRTFPSMT